MAHRHWAQWLPQRYATISEPDSYFSTLGQEVARQIEELTLDLAGDDRPGEEYLAKAGRLTAARSRAEEIVLPERVLLAPEPETSQDPEDNSQPPASPPRPPVIGPQPSGLGGGERRAGGAGAGQLAARFRPRSQDDLAPSGTVARTRANLAALATLRAIQRDDRPASPEEQAVLARWSGWGAVPEIFDERREEYAWAREELSALLNPARSRRRRGTR